MKKLMLAHLLAVSAAWGTVTVGTTPVEMFGWNNVSSVTTYKPIPIDAGTNRLLWCAVAYETGSANPSAAVSTATFAGVGLTFLDGQRVSVSGQTAVTEFWSLASPAVGTTSTLAVNWSATVDRAAVKCIALSGVNPSSPFGPTSKASSIAGDGTRPHATVTSQAGALVEEFLWYDTPNIRNCFAHGEPTRPGPGTPCLANARFARLPVGSAGALYPDSASSTWSQFHEYESPGAGSVDLDWFMDGDITGPRWTLIAVSINP